MGLENLKTAFDNIGKNKTVNPKSGVHSPVSDLSQDVSSFKNIPFTEIDSEFANKSIRLVGGQSLIDTEIPHSFGTNGSNEELIKIKKIEIKQEDSPQTKQEKIEINDEKIRDRESSLFQNLGQNNNLGTGDFILEKLYNINHTANIDRPTEVSYGQTKINFTRGGMGSLSELNIRGTQEGIRIGAGGSGEPYIVKNIGSIDYNSASRNGWPTFRLLDDVQRLAKFYSSGRGALTISKEAYYGSVFAYRYANAAPNKLNRIFFTTDYSYINPYQVDITTSQLAFANTINTGRLSTHTMVPAIPGINTGFLGGISEQSAGLNSIRKPFAFTYGFLLNQSKIKGASISTGATSVSRIEQLIFTKDMIDKATPDVYDGVVSTQLPFSILVNKNYSQEIINNGERKTVKTSNDNAYIRRKTLFGDEKTKPSEFSGLSTGKLHSVVDKINNTPVVDNEIEDERIKYGDFYVRIKDLRNNKYIYFRGFVTGITENVSPSYTSTNYIGRSEPVYSYLRAERDLSFNLRLYPNNPKELEIMYEKIEYLTGLCYPQYTGFPMNRMKAPFTELYIAHIGSKTQGQLGYIKSLTYTLNETGDWDIDNNLARLIDVSISYQIMNKKSPNIGVAKDSSDTDFESKTEFYRLTK